MKLSLKQAALMTAMFLGCLSCSKPTYTIDGIFTTADGTEVYLIDIDARDTLGTTTVKDGRFSFSGTVKEPVYVYVGREKTRVHLILEPGTVTADIDERVCSGTPMVDDYMAFHKRFYGYRRDQREEKAALADSVVMANRDNLVGALALEDLSYVDTARFMALHAQVSDKVRDFSLVKKACDAIELQQRTAPGRMFTDYTVTGGNPDGTDVKLSDYVGRGKFILLNHWASWCGPCKAEMPNVVKLYNQYKDKGFDIVSVSFDSKKENWLKAIPEWGMPWHHMSDLKGWGSEGSSAYAVNAIPHTILLGPDGTILARNLTGDALKAKLAELLP